MGWQSTLAVVSIAAAVGATAGPSLSQEGGGAVRNPAAGRYLAPPDQVKAFEDEMRAAGVADWQVISYGNTLHGFTNPAADGSMLRSALYSAQADRRSWAAMRSLFEEAFAR